MRVTLEKIAGVESVKVSLNDGRAMIALRPDNSVTLAQVREAVQRNGFTPKAAAVTVRAEVVATGDRIQLAVVGVDETFAAIAEETKDQLRSSVGKTVVVEGVIPPSAEKQQPTIQVKAVRPATRKSR